jgi:hypothetical protein
VQFLRRAGQVHAGGVIHLYAVPALAECLRFAPQRDHQGRHRHRLVHGVVAGFQPRQSEQVLEQVVHALRLPAHLVQHRLPFRVVLRFHQVQVAVHHGQRRAQFVRYVGDEIAAHLFQARELGDVAHDQQPLLRRVLEQAQAEQLGVVERRGQFQRRFFARALAQPFHQPRRVPQFAQRPLQACG